MLVDWDAAGDIVGVEILGVHDPSATQRFFDCWVQAGEELHAPSMLPLGVMNALLTGVRSARWAGHAGEARTSGS